MNSSAVSNLRYFTVFMEPTHLFYKPIQKIEGLFIFQEEILSSLYVWLALLKTQVSLHLGKVFSSDNGVSVSIMYSYMY